MPNQEMEADLLAIEQDAALRDERHFVARAEALDCLEFHILDGMTELTQANRFRQRARQVQEEMEAIDAALFRRLRGGIRRGRHRGTALRALVQTYLGQGTGGEPAAALIGYDHLDTFINGLLPPQPLPLETLVREPEMVYYQQTPARIVFELAAYIAPDDVFYDIGAGLGQVPILAHLLSGVPAYGIEVEPAYCAYAQACAAELGLPQVTFEVADARVADYTSGTVFFLYTPFGGQMLEDVLTRLRAATQGRPVTVFTYGPCTPAVARQPWLRCLDERLLHPYKLCGFTSRGRGLPPTLPAASPAAAVPAAPHR